MKRTPLRKKSKQSISLIQRKIWQECKRIIRKRYPNVCFTCGKTGLMGSNMHTGHLWAKASLGAYLKYDLRVLRPQCFHCNINLGGNGTNFYAKLMREDLESLNQLEKDRQITVNAMSHYQKILEEYKKL